MKCPFCMKEILWCDCEDEKEKVIYHKKKLKASRGEQACGMPLAVNPQEPHRRKGEITEVASRKSKANREPLASSPRISESLKKEGNDDWIMLSVGERGTGMSDCGLKIKQKLEGK